MFNPVTEVLIDVGALLSLVTTDSVPTGHGVILQLAFPTLIAYRAVVRMVQHQPFDYQAAHLYGFSVGCRNHHSILGRNHTGHLDALDRAFQELHGAEPAGSDAAQCRVVAEMGDNDSRLPRRLDDLGLGRDFNFDVVDD